MKKITVSIFCLMALYTQAQNTFPTTGNVGIGTLTPSATLQIGGGSGSLHFGGNRGVLLKSSTGDRALMEFHSPDGANRLVLQSLSNASYLGSLDGKPLIIQDYGGNVGIGTVNPKAQLDIYSNVVLGSTAGAMTDIVKIGSLSASSYNYSQLKVQLYRHTAGTDWFSASTRLQAATDVTNQGYIEFNPKGGPHGLALGTASGEAIKISGPNDVSISGRSVEISLAPVGGGRLVIGNNVNDNRIFLEGFSKDAAGSASEILITGYYARNLPKFSVWADTTCIRGNVGIGTTNPTQKLSVNGTIQAKEIIVNTGWSDFVFDNNYKLRPLTEVEQFVKTNKHLPEIPSQKEVEKNGVQLGDISSKLLMKIEELTLYMIEMKKEIEKQKAININLENGIKKLQNK